MRRENRCLGRGVRVAGALLLIGNCVPLASAQLANAGFEQSGGSLSGWTPFNNTVPNVLASPVTPRSGVSVAKVFGGFNGNPNYSGIFQNVPTAAGQVCQASAFTRHNSGDALTGTANRLLMKVEFYRVVGGAYGTADMLVEQELTVLDAGSPLNSWTPHTLQAVAPALTVEARVVFVFVQTGNQAGAALIDDVSFTATPPSAEWRLIWSDEFDGPTIDAGKWRVQDLHLIKNNELQYYAPDEVYLENGAVVLRSRQRTYWGFDTNGNWRQFNYTSGLVESIDRFATAYGRIEIRATLPGTQGIWPALWMLPSSGQWPPEIDIMELLGHQPTRVHMTHHWGQWPNVQSHTGHFDGPDFTAAFHTFAIEWTPQRIQWFVDGVVRLTSTVSIPREPFYIILNTAVGGDWPGNPNGSTVFPQFHRIDYVRVYQPSDPGPPLVSLADTTAGTATADGVLQPGEYSATLNGLNSGLADRIGSGSALHLDSTGDCTLNVAIDSSTAWPAAWPYGAVIYLDSQDGGLLSTQALHDTTNRSRRLVCGKSLTENRSDLYFAAGFTADFAVCIESALVTIYRLQSNSLELINGAALDSPIDLLGGTDVAYRVDPLDPTPRVRELRLPLSAIGVPPRGTLRFVATMLNGDTGFRSNEFMGVAAGNPWDTTNPGQMDVALKLGDYAEFRTWQLATCTAPVPCGDTNCDGVVDFFDIDPFLLALFDPITYGAAYPACTVLTADCNSDQSLDFFDIDPFLACLFSGSCS